LSGGGIILMRPQDLQMNASGKRDLAASIPTSELKQTKWTKAVGWSALGAGVLVGAIGVYQGLHSNSMVNQAQRNYSANGGTYLPSDVSTLQSAHTAATLGNVLTIGGALLVVSGAVLTFAF
jgi:hypothetical protein